MQHCQTKLLALLSALAWCCRFFCPLGPHHQNGVDTAPPRRGRQQHHQKEEEAEEGQHHHSQRGAKAAPPKPRREKAAPPTWRCQEGNTNPTQGRENAASLWVVLPSPSLLACRALPSCFFLVVPSSLSVLLEGATFRPRPFGCSRILPCLHASLFLGVGAERG